uniref:Histidine-type phosphatase n=1 Tax=Panagrolaimus sp. JU765 TaxID=591449 RepID=A0AC34RKL2_9BILA
MKTIIFFIFLFVDFCFGQKLIQANILWRHGDRAPLTSYSTDLVAEKEWGVHFGELTPLGLEQSFTKGLIIRQRYVRDLKLISPIYDSKQIFVRSTNVDRTLLSASAVLDGIYYDGEVEVPINSVHPLPAKTVNVPVHTVDYDTDYLL